MTTPAAEPGPVAPRLAYAPPPPWHRRRRFRRAIGGASLLAAVALGCRYGKPAWTRGRLLYLQHKCLTYTAPPEQVVYEQSPAPAVAAGAPARAALTPPCWAEAIRLVPAAGATVGGFPVVLGGTGATPGATLFLHERRSPGGQRRLVVLQTAAGMSSLFNAVPLLVEPGSVLAPPKARVPIIDADFDVHLPANLAGAHYRAFAGQPDPSDSSHFTARFVADGVPGTVDGWLRDNDHLALKVRDAAPAASHCNHLTGLLHVDPASGLTFDALQLTVAGSTMTGSVRVAGPSPAGRQGRLDVTRNRE